MLAKVSKKGQLTLPAEVRKRLNIKQGTYVRFVIEEGDVRLIPAGKGVETLRGSVQVTDRQDFGAARHRAMEEASRARAARTRR
ncbi:MAG: AbrB/MazE/SpoVT family DNA-binding domain-containing protein [Clostridia bacterium]|nr:AbrB/MazE/SpoVT family DNA-binding domain-containing protein [Clostridia bacterium]